MGPISRRGLERRFDDKWTDAMQRALCRFQPACVLCGATDDLTNQHVRPLNDRRGLEPGNAVRLCRACNSFICDRDPSKLSPGQARQLETAAAQFKVYWESGCTTQQAPTAVPAEETPKALDPDFIALLRAVERGDHTAIPVLANWLEERGDSRAAAIREVAGWQGVGRQQIDVVLRRLGLSMALTSTLKEYLGITPSGVAATFEEIAKRMGKRVQTIRHRIDLALHRLTVPSPHERH